MDQFAFTLKAEDGSEQRCKVVFTFDTDDFSYVIYSLVDENGNENDEVSALRYELDEDGKMTEFTPLETEEEWEMVDEVINTLMDEFGDEQDFFTVTDDDGNEILCEVLHRFEIQGFDNKYILYAYSDDEDLGEIFASAYVAGDNGEILELLPIESDEEWTKVEEELQILNQE